MSVLGGCARVLGLGRKAPHRQGFLSYGGFCSRLSSFYHSITLGNDSKQHIYYRFSVQDSGSWGFRLLAWYSGFGEVESTIVLRL